MHACSFNLKLLHLFDCEQYLFLLFVILFLFFKEPFIISFRSHVSKLITSLSELELTECISIHYTPP
jgi:hypothetical protein